MNQDIIAAHAHSANHKVEIENSALCGCFYCLATFKPSAIADWVDHGQTALCAFCGIDSVIGDKSGYQISDNFLKRMRAHWF